MPQEGHKKNKFHLKIRSAEDIIGSQNQFLSGISSSPPSGLKETCHSEDLHNCRAACTWRLNCIRLQECIREQTDLEATCCHAVVGPGALVGLADCGPASAAGFAGQVGQHLIARHHHLPNFNYYYCYMVGTPKARGHRAYTQSILRLQIQY